MTPSLENVKCYGQPEDCRGWRQFLVQRACPAVDPTGGPALPSLQTASVRHLGGRADQPA